MDISPINNNTNFGMAFRRYSQAESQRILSEALELNTKLKQRGFKQFVKEQDKLTRFDVRHSLIKDTIQVIDNKTDKVVNEYQSLPFKNAQNSSGEYGRNEFPIFDKIFNPKAFINFGFYQAGEKAKELEKQAIAREKSLKTVIDIIG